jgi:hypothetical protein
MDVPRRKKWFTCYKHGWDALGAPCPDCRSGDAPKHCPIHRWSHATMGCPQCQNGK